MPDLTHNGRNLDVVSANVKVKYRNASGKVVIADQASIISNSATIGPITELSIDTNELIIDNYDGGTGNPQDTDGGNYLTTWTTAGKEVAYTGILYNTNFLLEVAP